jgi:hypothetical protein
LEKYDKRVLKGIWEKGGKESGKEERKNKDDVI